MNTTTVEGIEFTDVELDFIKLISHHPDLAFSLDEYPKDITKSLWDKGCLQRTYYTSPIVTLRGIGKLLGEFFHQQRLENKLSALLKTDIRVMKPGRSTCQRQMSLSS